MDTLEFLKNILPDQGYKVLVEFAPGKRVPHQLFFKTHEELAAELLKRDAQGKTVYHACATFKTDENRTADNAGWMKSFWIDADVEPGNPTKYESQKAAVADIGRVCKELKLPLPLIVRSGNGIHAYWRMEHEIDAVEWRRYSAAFKSRLDALGFRQDRTRTADPASVLRPVGTQWRKDGVRQVQGIHPGHEVSVDQFRQAVGGGNPGRPSLGSLGEIFAGVDDNDLGAGQRTYAPSSAHVIVRHCPTLAGIAAVKGDCEEPLWRAMIGVVKYTTEGEALCHEWSSGYAGYDQAETQEKIDRWQKGPTTCAHFRGTNGNQCAGCTQTCTSPIQLGYTEEGGVAEVATTVAENETAEAFVAPLFWPKRHYYWNGTQLCRAVKDENDMVQWLPFCTSLFYPIQRVRDEEGTWCIRIRHRKRDKTWHEFNLPTELLGSQQGPAAALAAQEIFFYGKNAMQYAKEFLRDYSLDLQAHGMEQWTYSKMGWADEQQSFIIGNQKVTAQKDMEILTGEFINSAQWNVDWGMKGSVDGWASAVDLIYNRPGAEPYQFLIGVAFASPLVEITDTTTWHGIPVAVTGNTSLGKTTACLAATSIYGRPAMSLVPAQKGGDTMNAINAKMGTAKNLPLVIDEITQKSEHEISDFLYGASNGRPKDRVKSDGMLINHGLSWNVLTFMTSNRNVTALLSTLDQQNVAEATQLRVYEIVIDSDLLSRVWHGFNAREEIEHKLLSAQYGHVGREWLKFIMAHRDDLQEELRRARSKYSPNNADETRERYYRDLIAVVAVAMKHAYKFGYIKFDVAKTIKWAMANIKTLRARRHELKQDAGDQIAEFLSTLHGKIIVTKYFTDAVRNTEAPLERMVGSPVARQALDDKVFVVARSAIAEWCRDKKLDVGKFIEEMDSRNFIVWTQDKNGARVEERRDRLGKGTGIPSTPTVIIELKYDAVIGTLKKDDK